MKRKTFTSLLYCISANSIIQGWVERSEAQQNPHNHAVNVGLRTSTQPTTGIINESLLLKLTRLPWLRHHYLPNWLRQALLEALPTAQQRAVRQQLETLLQNLHPEAESKEDLPLPLAQHTWQPFWKTDGKLQDHVFLDFMNGYLAVKAHFSTGKLLRHPAWLIGFASVVALVGHYTFSSFILPVELPIQVPTEQPVDTPAAPQALSEVPPIPLTQSEIPPTPPVQSEVPTIAKTTPSTPVKQPASSIAPTPAPQSSTSALNPVSAVASPNSSGNENAIQTALANVGDVRKVLADGLPPQLELVSQQQDGDSLKLSFRIKAQSGGLGKLSYRINDVQQANAWDIGVGPTGLEPIEMVIPLVKGRNIIAVNVNNKDGSISSLPLRVEANYTPPELKKPTLYVLAVGVSKYQDATFKLNFADKDALAVMAAMKKGGGRLFELRPENLLTLTNEQVTLDSLQKAFAQIASRAKPDDVFVFYLAGHGKTFDGRYYFIPSNAVYRNQKDFLAASLGEEGLTKLLQSVRAQKSVVLLDTCYAGNYSHSASSKNLMLASRGSSWDEKFAISRLVKATGRAIFAGASDNQLALEGYKGHGYFTYALLEGLQGAADEDKDKVVSIKELDRFLAERAPLLSKNRQTPAIELAPNFVDFAITTVP